DRPVDLGGRPPGLRLEVEDVAGDTVAGDRLDELPAVGRVGPGEVVVQRRLLRRGGAGQREGTEAKGGVQGSHVILSREPSPDGGATPGYWAAIARTNSGGTVASPNLN